jgi:hypothetical protein
MIIIFIMINIVSLFLKKLSIFFVKNKKRKINNNKNIKIKKIIFLRNLG